jgi:hypothetical protein
MMTFIEREKYIMIHTSGAHRQKKLNNILYQVSTIVTNFL